MNFRSAFEQRLPAAILSLTLCTWNVYGQETDPVRWSLQIASAQGQQQNKFVAQLKAEIAPGWHLYGMEQGADGPRPLRITLPTTKTYELEAVHAPMSQVERDANFDAPTRYYENVAVFELPIIRRTSDPLPKLIVDVRYQVCNRQLCLPPTTVRLEAEN